MAKKLDYASLYTLRADGRYMGYMRGKDGKRHAVYDRDPEALFRKLNGTSEPDHVTFGAIAEAWREAHWSKIREGTKACYAAPYRRAVERFSGKSADEIMPADIGKHLLQMKAQGYSSKSIKTQRTIYSLIYQHAIADEDLGKLVRSNPAEGSVLPSGMKRPKKRSAPEDDVVSLIRERAETAYWGVFCLFLISTGFRRGEALALQWRDVDLDDGTISCTKALVYRNGAATVSDTKTENGVREVPILPDLRPVLEEYGKNKKPENYVFPGEDPKKPMPEVTYRRRWLHYCKDMGFVTDTPETRKSAQGKIYTVHHYKPTLTAHVMRHSYATMLYDAGVDPYTAQKLLGHADIQTTLAIYTHLKQQRENNSIKKLKDYVTDAIGKKD
ncbi:MAG: site-specific integrase [Oscillospiraceae bacterium]|nr:site-specific integrase [Oscillospiraceae bacterium]